MKVRLYLTLLLFCTVIFSSCDPYASQKRQLSEHIIATQPELPLNMGALGAITDIKYNNDLVTFVYLLNENECDINILIEDSMLVKKNFQCMVARNNNLQNVVQEIIDAHANLKLVYEGQESGKSVSIMLTNDEMSDDGFMLSKLEAAKILVDNTLTMERKKMPMDMGDGIMLVNSFCEENQIVYLAQLDKTYYSIQSLQKADKNQMKQGIVENLSSDKSTRALVEALASIGKEICYRYQVENDDEYVDIVLGASDLRQILSEYAR